MVPHAAFLAAREVNERLQRDSAVPVEIERPGRLERLQASAVEQALSWTDATRAAQEGGFNAADGKPTNFVFPAETDVRETDKILYDGWRWEIFRHRPNRPNGIVLNIHCIAFRSAPLEPPERTV